MRQSFPQRLALTLVAATGFAASAAAAPINVDIDAIDSIYNATAAGFYSTGNPVLINVPTGTHAFTFALTSGGQTISLNSGGNQNDADGTGAAVASSSTNATSTLSGIQAPGAGYITGVFLGATNGVVPASLSYSSASTGQTSYAPLLQQVFFVGDGLTGDATGGLQTFLVPTGAVSLFLGISDAPGYNGDPGAYGDNSGTFSGAVTLIPNDVTPPTNGVPEPTALALLGAGLVGFALARRRKA